MALDGNTLVIGAATWCGATQKLVAALQTPEVAAQLSGLHFIFAFDDEGGAVEGVPGELVCTKPFPSMPVCFLNDADGVKYRNAYFNKFPGKRFSMSFLLHLLRLLLSQK